MNARGLLFYLAGIDRKGARTGERPQVAGQVGSGKNAACPKCGAYALRHGLAAVVAYCLRCALCTFSTATAASLSIAAARSSRLQAVCCRADVWPVRHLRPEAMPDRVIQPAPEATLDPSRCVRRRRDQLRQNPLLRHAAIRPSDLLAARPEGRRAFRGRG